MKVYDMKINVKSAEVLSDQADLLIFFYGLTNLLLDSKKSLIYIFFSSYRI